MFCVCVYMFVSLSHSDVVLVTSDNKQFHAHRLVLCAQSSVLKAMLDSDLWAESRNKEVGVVFVLLWCVCIDDDIIYRSPCQQ